MREARALPAGLPAIDEPRNGKYYGRNPDVEIDRRRKKRPQQGSHKKSHSCCKAHPPTNRAPIYRYRNKDEHQSCSVADGVSGV